MAIAAAFLGVSASSASAADDVWLWACHGPDGRALGDPGPRSNPNNTNANEACGSNDPGRNDFADGLMATLPADVNSPFDYTSSWRFDVPPDLALRAVSVYRQTSALGEGQRYALRTVPAGGAELESREAGQTPFTQPATFTGDDLGDFVNIGLTCAPGCAQPEGGPARLSIAALGMKVGDTSEPTAALGGTRSPAAGTLSLEVPASDTGSGLRYADAVIGGVYRRHDFADGNCRDITPDTSTVDLPFGANCAHTGTARMELNTGLLVNDTYTLTVRVFDWAGNKWERSTSITVLNNPDLGSPTATLNIGTAGVAVPQPAPGPSGGSGGVAGAAATACRSPRLSVFLAQKPLRVRRNRPVLQRGKRYRFNGRLTCVINGRRRSAPKRTRVDILNRVRSRTVEKAGTTIRDRGRLTVILAYRSSRTIIFRFTNNDGQRSQVRLPIQVARR